MTGPAPGERRQFERLDIKENALALDEQGHQLGRVSQASGSGFLIYPASPQALEQLTMGRRMRITVLEPETRASNTLDVEVRRREGEAVGVMFVANP